MINKPILQLKEYSKNDKFWAKQVSDLVPDGIIPEISKNCEKQECEFSCTKKGSTLMGYSTHYDKFGFLHNNNPNHFVMDIVCSKCWRAWEVKT